VVNTDDLHHESVPHGTVVAPRHAVRSYMQDRCEAGQLSDINRH
jgi:hypothetical protein